MRENVWTNTKTRIETTATRGLGSPRAWVNRALDYRGVDLYLHPTTPVPRQISVAGVWREGTPSLQLPYYSIIRIWRGSTNLTGRPGSEQTSRYVGHGYVVPMNQVMSVYNQLVASGAEWVWWSRPEQPKSNERSVSELKHNKKLDHDRIFQLLDQGLSTTQIALEIGSSEPAVFYVKKKWQHHTNA